MKRRRQGPQDIPTPLAQRPWSDLRKERSWRRSQRRLTVASDPDTGLAVEWLRGYTHTDSLA